MIKIAYLGAEDSSMLDFNSSDTDVAFEDIQKEVKEHPNKEIYDIEDFVNAFNDDRISDLGYIAIIDV